jgi:hypothetical protein
MAALTASMSRPGATADLGPGGPPAAGTARPAGGDRPAAVSSGTRTIRSWPLLVLAAPAAAEVWAGWAGIAAKTGFGLVSPLPGIWPALRLDTAITLPVGVEAYAAYALRAWLSRDQAVSARTRRFAAAQGPDAGPRRLIGQDTVLTPGGGHGPVPAPGMAGAGQASGPGRITADQADQMADQAPGPPGPVTAVSPDGGINAAAVAAYRASLQVGRPLSERKLAGQFGKTSRRWARNRMAEARQSLVPA